MIDLMNMTPQTMFPELKERLKKIEVESGLPAARATLGLSRLGGGSYFYFEFVPDHRKSVANPIVHPPSSGTLEEGFAKFEKMVRDFVGDRRRIEVKKLALKLIELGAEATEVKLRNGGWSQDELDEWGADAEAQAEKLAAGGPFKIRREDGRNEPAEGVSEADLAGARKFDEDELPF